MIVVNTDRTLATFAALDVIVVACFDAVACALALTCNAAWCTVIARH